MRVALDVTPLLGAPTGVHQAVRGVVVALAAHAPQVQLDPYVLSRRARRAAPLVVAGRTTLALPLPAGLAIRAWGRSDRPRADRWLGGADVVHGSNFAVPPMRSRPTVATVHDCWCARRPERCRPEVVALTAAVRRAVARGAWLHVTTEHGRAEVAEVYGATERVVVVPFGVPTEAPPLDVAPHGRPPSDPSALDPSVCDPSASGPSALDRSVPSGGRPAAGAGGPGGGRPYVLALGALDERKGLIHLVGAFAAVAASDPDLVLVIAGPDGPARPAVDDAVAALPTPTRDRVRVVGPVDDPNRRMLLSGATVLAYPSLDEGFGFPVLEAMAAGVPVVASRVGALPEVAGGGAELVAAGDVDGLAAALLAVCGDAARRRTLVAAGSARAATFTWERTATGLVDLWNTAAAAGP